MNIEENFTKAFANAEMISKQDAIRFARDTAIAIIQVPNVMSRVHKTREGLLIPLFLMDMKHLENTIKLIDKYADSGVTLVDDFGNETTIYGKQVRARLHYGMYVQELKSRTAVRIHTDDLSHIAFENAGQFVEIPAVIQASLNQQ